MRRVLGVLVLAGLGGCAKRPACGQVQALDPQRAVPSPVAGQLIHSHAHNDYEHARPLLDALDAHLYSVEADIFYDGGSFKVAHDAFETSKGTLKGLYLDPLQARVDAQGSVYGDGEGFTLWIDIKESNDALPDALRTLLGGYGMLTRFGDGGVAQGPVTAVLTGDATMKAAVVSASDRAAVRDSNDYAPDDPPADTRWRYYALNWGDYLGWNGVGTIPADDQQRMACIVNNAHFAGRQVRFYATPDRAEDWRAELADGVDFINTDHLAELSAVLASEP